MEKGEYFGEQSMLYDCNRTATVTAAAPEVDWVTLSRSELNKALGEDLPRVIYVNTLRMALERSNIFRFLYKEQLESII